jgi:hypothetical protein
MRTALPTSVIIGVLLFSGCAMFQRTELIRRQNVRDEANRYATGDWLERLDAVKRIVNFYGPEKNTLIIGTLLVALNDPYTSIRIEALKGLAKCRDQSTHAAIRKIAADDEKNPDVRWYALRALRVFKDPGDIDVFIKGLRSKDWIIREASVKGLCMMDDATIKKHLIPYVIEGIDDPETSVAITTLRWLKTKDTKFYAAIVNKFNACNEYNYSMLKACLIALKGYKLDGKTRQKVINLLVHPNIKIRILALRVLKKDQMLSALGNG